MGDLTRVHTSSAVFWLDGTAPVVVPKSGKRYSESKEFPVPVPYQEMIYKQQYGIAVYNRRQSLNGIPSVFRSANLAFHFSNFIRWDKVNALKNFSSLCHFQFPRAKCYIVCEFRRQSRLPRSAFHVWEMIMCSGFILSIRMKNREKAQNAKKVKYGKNRVWKLQYLFIRKTYYTLSRSRGKLVVIYDCWLWK